MGVFDCAACKAKDDEIKWLRNELEIERRTRSEIEKPGITRTVEPDALHAREPFEPPPPKPVSKPTFPGYEPSGPREVEVT